MDAPSFSFLFSFSLSYQFVFLDGPCFRNDIWFLPLRNSSLVRSIAFFVLTALVFALDCRVLRKHFMLDHVLDTLGNLISLFSLDSACEDTNLLKVHGHIDILFV